MNKINIKDINFFNKRFNITIMQEEILKLVKAAIEGNTEAQKQIEEILQVAQQPDADPKIVKVAKFIMQMLQPESAKKGCKTKKKPLIPTKKCGDKVKKGGFGFPSKKCSCVLRRMGGTIIEVDSCTGLPYRKSGGILKGQRGTEAWYNTSALSGTQDGIVEGEARYYKDGNQWKKQVYNESTGWGNAEDFSDFDIKNKDFIEVAYAKGYDPTTGFFNSEDAYINAINGGNVKIGNNTQVTRGGTTLTFIPVKTDGAEEGYGIKNNALDIEGKWGIVDKASYDEKAAKEALWTQRNYYRLGLRNKTTRDGWFEKHFDDMKKMGIIDENTNMDDVNRYNRKNYLKKFLGTNQSINKLYNGNAKTYGNEGQYTSKLGDMVY